MNPKSINLSATDLAGLADLLDCASKTISSSQPVPSNLSLPPDYIWQDREGGSVSVKLSSLAMLIDRQIDGGTVEQVVLSRSGGIDPINVADNTLSEIVFWSAAIQGSVVSQSKEAQGYQSRFHSAALWLAGSCYKPAGPDFEFLTVSSVHGFTDAHLSPHMPTAGGMHAVVASRPTPGHMSSLQSLDVAYVTIDRTCEAGLVEWRLTDHRETVAMPADPVSALRIMRIGLAGLE